MLAVMAVVPCQARRIAVGDAMPAVSAKTMSGAQYDRPVGSNRAVLIAFLSAGQKASQRAAQDLRQIIPSYADHRQKLDIVIIMDDPVFKDSFKDTSAVADHPIHMVHDDQKECWGQFHIIVAPTVVIADASDKVSSVIAGHGYDFIRSLRFHLNEVLGIEQAMTAEDVGKVKTAQNQTVSDRVQRHLKMAKMLQEKGKIDAAMKQLDQAREINPDDRQIVLQIGRLHCLQNKPDLAMKAMEGPGFATPGDKAGYELILGWANRLSGNLELAKQHLLKATELSPTSARAFFELGQTYEAGSENDKALKAYKQALSILIKTE
jgi:tetratricopeptide (TPR) repeat protein